MNEVQNQIQKLSEMIERYRSGVIALQANPSMDGVAAAVALYLALTKKNKNVSIVCSTPPQGVDLVGADKIQNSLSSGGNHLVISFPYQEGVIDKVDYTISGNAFNLIIIPNSEGERIDPKDVKFSYTGGKIEFVVTIDVPNLNSLGAIYTDNQNDFQSKNIVNIDRHLINNNFGTVNIVNKQASATSEIVYQIIREMNIEIDKDIATALYNGILVATNNFSSYSVNPVTFEAAGTLMKMGAQKKQLGKPQPAAFGNQAGFCAPPAPGGFPPASGGFGAPGGFGGGFGGNFGNQSAPQNPPQNAQPAPFGGTPRPNPFAFMNQDNNNQQNPGFGGFPSAMAPEPDYEEDTFPPMPQSPMMGGMQGQRDTQTPQPVNPPQQQQQETLPPQNQQQKPPQNQESGGQEQPSQNQNQGQPNQKNPQDWLKPKLFRGSNLM